MYLTEVAQTQFILQKVRELDYLKDYTFDDILDDPPSDYNHTLYLELTE